MTSHRWTYPRALQTAAILSQLLNIGINVEIDLRERDLDTTFQMKDFEEIKSLIISEEKAETLKALKDRTLNVLNRYRNYSKVIVATHGYVITSLTGIVDPPYCAVYKYLI